MTYIIYLFHDNAPSAAYYVALTIVVNSSSINGCPKFKIYYVYFVIEYDIRYILL